ncbi:MAG: rRNA maturation RNase YbeY [Clostridiaceae bacterium]|jgi:probable rRNA maturation factor|nr:rRNA maturation RNase YbeY [Clostridiaceae bacterium]
MISQFVNRLYKTPTDAWRDLLCRVLGDALPVLAARTGLADLGRLAGNEPAEPGVTVYFAGPWVMRQTNRTTRGQNRLTDVLSFPLLDFRDGTLKTELGVQDFERLPDDRTILPLGEIMIAPAVAARQAEAYGHSLEREIAFLGVHGLLHLLGYDHDTPKRERQMFALQEDVLQAAGLTRPGEDQHE